MKTPNSLGDWQFSDELVLKEVVRTHASNCGFVSHLFVRVLFLGLVAVLCNNASGMSAVYAEPGTGNW